MAADQADKQHWEDNADNWIAWTRSSQNDAFHSYQSAFRQFVGSGASKMLEVGCGEGRVARLLRELGYHVTATDPVAAFIDAAKEMNSADAYAIAMGDDQPFDDATFDAAVAYNVLMDVEDISSVLAETARVLKPNGELIICIVHPFADIGRFVGEASDAEFHIDTPYFGRKRFDDEVERDGVKMHFGGWSQPLSNYVGALQENGFAITALEEPQPADGAEHERLQKWRRMPMFLWIRALRLKGE